MRKVLKYGGSSLGSVEQIEAVGKYIASLEDEIIVVVSAMSDTTDKLIEMANEIGNENGRETDVLLSTGELCSSALLALTVEKYGKNAVSLSGMQAGIITDNNHTDADIIYIDTTRIENELKMGKTVIIAGFQGATENGEVTTLGRGGSDTTAVAIAAALKCPCEIYTDVDGVYDKDPTENADANKLHRISHEKMLELSTNGADILSIKAAKIAEKYRVPIYIGKALETDKTKGTHIGSNAVNIAVVGASGIVGRTFLKALEERKTDINEIYLYGRKSVGTEVEIMGKTVKIQELSEANIIDKNIDYTFFSAGKEVSLKYAEIFQKMGTVVIDNSSAWRMDESVPLIVPQVNREKAFEHKNLIANPNCSTIQSVIPLSILHNKYTVKAVSFTTFQAVSGNGMKGVNDLERTLKGEKQQLYPYPISRNCIPQIGDIIENGYTEEEMKMISETRKILENNDMHITASCIRVPIVNGHAVDIYATLEKPFEIEDIKRCLAESESIILCEPYPVTDMSNGTDKVYVGRVRRDITDPQSLHIWCTADNVRRGAAINAIEILELLERRKYES